MEQKGINLNLSDNWEWFSFWSTHLGKAKSSRGNNEKQVQQSTDEFAGTLARSNLQNPSCLTFRLYSSVACFLVFTVHSSPHHLVNSH